MSTANGDGLAPVAGASDEPTGPTQQPEQTEQPEPSGPAAQPAAAGAGRGRLGKRNATVVVLLPAAVLLLLATRPWANGSARDVLTAGVTQVAGTTAAPGVPGLAVVAVVALLGLLTGGRVIRLVSAVVMVVASMAVLALTAVVALAPVQAVADAVARELARTTAPDTVGHSTVWVWLALGVAVLLAVGAVITAVSSRSWAGLSSRYERGSRPAGGPRGQALTAWDELSDGGDPTVHDDNDAT